MFKVQKNQSLRNVAENSLKDMRIAKHTVFFGINGSGKSTVSEVLGRHAQIIGSDGNLISDKNIYLYDEQWRETTVGQFVEGGTAQSVTTVNLNQNAGEVKKQLETARNCLKQAEENRVSAQSSYDDALEKRKKLIADVFNGERKRLEKDCPELSGTRFNRKHIESQLCKGNNIVLADSTLRENIQIAETMEIRPLPKLPSFPRAWAFSLELWNDIVSHSGNVAPLKIILNDWVREGLNLHKAGDSCQFCGQIVNQSRIEQIQQAIDLAASDISPLVMSQSSSIQDALNELSDFYSILRRTDLSDSLYSKDLEPKKSKVLLEISPLLNALKESQEIIAKHIRNPFEIINETRPTIDYSKLEKQFQDLSESYSEAERQIEKHSLNRTAAVTALKSHCCALDGSNWDNVNTEIAEHSELLEECKTLESEARNKLKELQSSISTTEATATFIDDGLTMILGEKSLRVSEGEPGQGYQITRYGSNASGMSEGEKKLVSLLYFCAEFETSERKSQLKDSIVIFDDLGSELDETRLLAVDRFITDHFSKSSPSLVYLTHSHVYLKILQSRLMGKISETKKDNQVIEPKAIFYEIYKDFYQDENKEQTTKWRQWDDKAVKLINDYWLAFYKVLDAFDSLTNGKVPDYGTGNFCRKVVEGFTEFRAPCNDQFGVRLNTLLSENNLGLNPALSKVLNGVSHSNLSKSGGVLSRAETEQAVIQTLALIQRIDQPHFESMLRKFRGKEKWKALAEELNKLLPQEE